MRPSFVWGIRVAGFVIVLAIALMLLDSLSGDPPNGLALLPAITFCVLTVVVYGLARFFVFVVRR
jgi:hypothetical protein